MSCFSVRRVFRHHSLNGSMKCTVVSPTPSIVHFFAVFTLIAWVYVCVWYVSIHLSFTEIVCVVIFAPFDLLLLLSMILFIFFFCYFYIL